MNTRNTAGARAREIVRRHALGALSTLSAEMDGWPFGSLGPYVLDHAGEPYLLLSDIAQHSRNIKRDPRACLLVSEQNGAEEDAQAYGRVSLLGYMHIEEPDEAFRARYLRYFPQAASFFQTHDFRFYHLRLEKVRFIGGFGDIHWVAADDYRLTQQGAGLAELESGAVEHMNVDHVEAMKGYCKRVHGLAVETPRLIGVDPEGFDLDTEKGRLRFKFPQPVWDAQALRQAMVALARD